MVRLGLERKYSLTPNQKIVGEPSDVSGLLTGLLMKTHHDANNGSDPPHSQTTLDISLGTNQSPRDTVSEVAAQICI